MGVTEADFDNVDSGEERLLIASSGYYPALFVSYETRKYNFRGKEVEKLIVYWKVLTHVGTDEGPLLPRFYNLERNKAMRFKFGHLSDYRKDWVAANGGRQPLDRGKIPITKFREGRFLVEVVTVSHDAKGRPIKGLEWSRINSVLRPVDAKEQFDRLPVQSLVDTG